MNELKAEAAKRSRLASTLQWCSSSAPSLLFKGNPQTQPPQCHWDAHHDLCLHQFKRSSRPGILSVFPFLHCPTPTPISFTLTVPMLALGVGPCEPTDSESHCKDALESAFLASTVWRLCAMMSGPNHLDKWNHNWNPGPNTHNPTFWSFHRCVHTHHLTWDFSAHANIHSDLQFLTLSLPRPHPLSPGSNLTPPSWLMATLG